MATPMSVCTYDRPSAATTASARIGPGSARKASVIRIRTASNQPPAAPGIKSDEPAEAPRPPAPRQAADPAGLRAAQPPTEDVAPTVSVPNRFAALGADIGLPTAMSGSN